MTKCIRCGRELDRPPWWKFWADRAPFCGRSGTEGDLCWLGLNKRMGIENPGPKPR